MRHCVRSGFTESYMENEEMGVEEFVLDDEMIWGTQIENDQFRIYINENQTLTFSKEAAQVLYAVLKGYVESGELKDESST